MRLPRLKAAALAVIAAALALAGCSSDSTSLNVQPGMSGSRYALATVNGTPLPAQVRNDAGGTVTIVQGSVEFAGDSFAQVLTLSELLPGTSSSSSRQSTASGTFTVRGDRIQFHASDGGEWEGVLSGGRLDYAITGNYGAVAFSFQRS